MSTSPSEPELSIDIDDSILAAALAAVEARTPASARKVAPARENSPSDVDIEVDGLEAEGVPPSRSSLEDDLRGRGRSLAAPGAASPSGERSLPTLAASGPGGANGGSVPSATPPPAAADLARLRFRLDEAAHAHRKAEAELARLRASLAESEGRTLEAREAARLLTEDLERARARGKRDAEEAQRRGEESVLRVLLDVFDNVERARHHDDVDPAALRRGVTMTSDQLRRQIERLGLERVTATPGTAFDPNVHEAMAHAPHADLPEGAVAEELQAGFCYKGRLLRAARVTVAASRGAS